MKSIIITDSRCDLSINLDNVVVIKRFICLNGSEQRTTESFDYRNHLFADCFSKNYFHIAKSFIPEVCFDEAFFEAFENRKADEVLFLAPNRRFNLASSLQYYQMYVDAQRAGYNVSYVESSLDGIALGLLLIELNDLIAHGYSAKKLIDYIHKNEKYYRMIVYSKNGISTSCFENFAVKHAKKASPIFVNDIKRQLVLDSLIKTSDINASLIAKVRQQNIDDTIMFGNLINNDENSSIKEYLMQSQMFTNKYETGIGKINLEKYGSDAIALAYRLKKD